MRRLTAQAALLLSDLTPATALAEAFTLAQAEFFDTYGRAPNLSLLDIKGGFTSTSIILEIVEDE